MHTPDRIAVVVVLVFWLFLDGCVIAIDRDDHNMYRYLTNQVWCLALLSKSLLIIDLLRHRASPDGEGVDLYGWHTSLIFIIVGCAQFGVLGAFFLLVWLDSTLLDNMLAAQQHSIAEIIAWNHLRHVTVCFVHLALTWSLRHYLSRNAHESHSVNLVGCDVKFGYAYFGGCVIVAPLVIGLAHAALFDDQELYRFGSIDVGSKCQVAFAFMSIAAGVYYLCVPLRSSSLERGGCNCGGEGCTVCSSYNQFLPVPNSKEPEPIPSRCVEIVSKNNAFFQ